MPPWVQPSRLVSVHTRLAWLVCPCCDFLSLCLSATVGGNVIVNTVAGVPQSPFQANKRLASPVIPGTLSVSPLSAPIWCGGSFTHLQADLWVCFVCICLACKCSRSPGGPRTAEGRDGCCAHRSGCHSSGSGGASGDTGHGVCSGFYHSEPSSVADASNGHSGHTRYVCPHKCSIFLDAPKAHSFLQCKFCAHPTTHCLNEKTK